MTEVSKQFKYAFKHGVALRYIPFGIVLAVNIVFGALALSGILGFAAAVTAVSLSGTGLGVVILMNIFADISSLQGILRSPNGYAFALVPVKSSKILFARITAIAVQDILTLAVSIPGTVWLSFYLADLSISELSGYVSGANAVFEFVGGIVYAFINYSLILMFIVFCVVLRKSIFFNRKGRTLLTILSGAVVFWVLSLLDFALFPFTAVENYFAFSPSWLLTYNLVIFDALGLFIFAVIGLIKIAALFITTSILMERRINI